MSKKFDDILSEKVKELPYHVPGDHLWENIEAALRTDDAIRSTLPDMPLHSPSPSVWETIEAKLPSTSKKDLPSTIRKGLPSSRINRIPKRYLVIAASVAAAALLLLFIPGLVKTGSSTVVESEIILSAEQDAGETFIRENEDPMEVITNLCQTEATICQSALFREKLQLFQELTRELRQLETVIDQVGDSPEIIQSVIRIENLKSSTLQEMIQMIHS